MKLICLYGPPAAGKYTIGRRLSVLSGWPLFHNHLVVDAVAAVFPFGSPSFIALRERIWLDVISAAARDNRSVIFTFQPETTVSDDFPARLVECVRSHGGQVDFVYLRASISVQMSRIANPDRARFGKLRSPDLAAQLQQDFARAELSMPTPVLTIDTGQSSMEQAVEFILPLLTAAKRET